MTSRTRRLGTGLTTASVLAASLLVAAPARASTTLDCTTGPVTLTQALTEYDLVGACGDVVVAGTNITVRLASAATLTISPGAGQAVVTATGRLDTVVMASAGATVSAPSIGSATLRSIQARLTADKVDTITSRAGSARVRVRTARSLTVTGPSSIDGRFVFTRLSRVRLKNLAFHNTVRVRKGSTRVDNASTRRNTVLVHRLARR